MPRQVEFRKLSLAQQRKISHAFDSSAQSSEENESDRRKRRKTDEAGGFVIDDDDVEPSEEHEQMIRLDRVPRALQLLNIEDSADVLDVFRAAVDDNELVTRQDFEKIVAVLLIDEEEEQATAVEKGKPRKAKPAPKKQATLTKERLAVIDKLWVQFTTTASGGRTSTFGADSIKAVAGLVGDLKWTDADIDEMVEHAGTVIDKAAFTAIVVKSRVL